MSVPLTLLGLLEREPSHGYDLKRDYDAYFGRGKPLPFGQVYATLGRLARDGKVVVGETEPGAGPDRKRYVITDDGATEVETWLGRAGRARAAPADGAVRQGRARADARAGDAERYLDAQRAAHLQRMRELTEVKRSGGLVDALLADHGLFHLEADLRWIDLTAARLDALAAGGAVMTAGRSEARDVAARRSATTPGARGASRRRRGRARSSPSWARAAPGKSTLLHCLAGILVPDGGRGPVRRPADRHPARGRAQRACAATGSGSCSSSASWCPS